MIGALAAYKQTGSLYIRIKPQFKAMTGVTREMLDRLVPRFGAEIEKRKVARYRKQRKNRAERVVVEKRPRNLGCATCVYSLRPFLFLILFPIKLKQGRLELDVEWAVKHNLPRPRDPSGPRLDHQTRPRPGLLSEAVERFEMGAHDLNPRMGLKTRADIFRAAGA